MAATGRGRGRGRGLLGRDGDTEDSNRPGPGASGDTHRTIVENGSTVKKESTSGQESLTELQDVLEKLSLNCSDQDIENILQLADSASCSASDIEKMAETVYDKCISDREFAKTGAFICDKLACIEEKGTKFRSSLLSQVQKDYKDKDEIRGKSVSKFLNIFSFMCQIFGVMRTVDGEVFKPLVTPVYELFNLILDSEQTDNDEYECLNEQLQAIGRELEQNNREKMEALMAKIRAKIIRNGASAPVRCCLLELVECYCRGWRDLANDVTRFYCDTMMDIITD